MQRGSRRTPGYTSICSRRGPDKKWPAEGPRSADFWTKMTNFGLHDWGWLDKNYHTGAKIWGYEQTKIDIFDMLQWCSARADWKKLDDEDQGSTHVSGEGSYGLSIPKLAQSRPDGWTGQIGPRRRSDGFSGQGSNLPDKKCQKGSFCTQTYTSIARGPGAGYGPMRST